MTTLLLALLGLASAAYSFGLRMGLAVGTIACGVLSLGLPSYAHPDRGFTPYRLLYEFAPGWDAVRTPSRINNLTALGLALLAGAGLALVVRHARRVSARGVLAVLAVTVLVGAILLEGIGPLTHSRVPAEPRSRLATPPPQLHLPFGIPEDAIYAYWSIDGFPEIVNGTASFTPASYPQIISASTTFPDSASVAFLRRLGVRSVVLHRDYAPGTAWQNAADRPIEGLGISREDDGNLVVYRLEPTESGG